MIKRRIPWTRKPSYRSSINRANPIAKGLVRYWQGESFIDLNNNRIPNDHTTQADPILSASIHGKAIDFGVGGFKTLAESTTTPISGSQNRTFVALIYHDQSNSGNIFHINDGTVGTTGARWTVRVDASLGLRIEIQGSGYTSSLIANTGWHFVAVTLNGSTLADHTLYVDGASEAATGASSVATGSAYSLRLGGRNSSGTTEPTVEKIAWGALWDRALSVAELDRLYREQYQLLQPITKYIPISTGAEEEATFQAAWANTVNTLIGNCFYV